MLTLFAVVSVLPLVWLAIAPSKTNADVVNRASFAFGSWSGYSHAWHGLLSFESGVLLKWIMNSVWYNALIVVISVTSALLAGYALAFLPMLFRRTLLLVTLVAMIVPPVALVLPLFITVNELGIYNTPWAVILTSSLYPFGVFLAYIFYTTSVPRELLEASRMDGASEARIFWSVALPLSKGLAGMLAFFSFTAGWVNYFLPYVLLSTPEKLSLPVGLGVLFSSTPALNPGLGANASIIGRPEIALAGLIVIIPILIVFLASARFLVRGVLAGAVKS